MGNQTEVTSQNPKYVWAIKSTLSPTVRQAVVFDSFNPLFPAEQSVRKLVRHEIARMAKGEEFAKCIVPRIGWFLHSMPARVPPIFIANEFLVIRKSVWNALSESILGGEVDLYPFRLLDAPNGVFVGDFLVLCVKARDSMLCASKSAAAVRFHKVTGRYRILATAQNDTIFLRQDDQSERSVWIDSEVADAIFMTDEVGQKLMPFLRESGFALVRCILGD